MRALGWLMCCRGNRDLITTAIHGLFWWSSVWLWLRRSELREVRLQAQALTACAIHCNYCMLLPFTQITVIILHLDVLISNRCYLNKYKAPRDPEDTEYSSYWAELVFELLLFFFFALHLVLKLQESSLTAFKWNIGGWDKLSHFLL